MAESSMPDLVVSKLEVRAKAERGAPILVRDASFTLSGGEMSILVGPNGAGKTTLLRAAMGLLTPSAGRVRLGGEDPARMSPSKRARKIAWLPQIRPLAWPNRVRDIVSLGRFAYGASPGRLGEEDAAAVDRAMAAAGLAAFSERSADTLSGGEIARMHCARALAAQAPLLLADEPVAALDIRHQLQVMTLLQRHARRGGGVLAVLHDIALAARFADRLLWMKQGSIVASGPCEETLDSKRIESVFGVRAQVAEKRVEIEEPI
ncbi:ABC transporter ATP-binding protein [Thioalkalivibrio sp. HK1]|uniref:ABC transporter ATP-binding protein n=1 Tax=Thioalkalivibrio sp. HK1 TaxID=1469245 RepID=UPI0004B91EF8|nr:ABC transporter ATP-binding protein [Thioalkalivibrio sp. HK1]